MNMWNPMTVFWHVLSRKLSSSASRSLNSEEKWWKQSVNLCWHLLSAWEETDVAVAVSVTLGVHSITPSPSCRTTCAVCVKKTTLNRFLTHSRHWLHYVSIIGSLFNERLIIFRINIYCFMSLVKLWLGTSAQLLT